LKEALFGPICLIFELIFCPAGLDMARLGATLFGVFLIFIPVSSVYGHGDHDAAPPVVLDEVPRLESSGTDLELVATAEGHTLTIYLDRLATNEPVDGATIEVSGDGIAPVTAKPVGNGTYAIDAEWADQPGTKALIFTVTVGDTSDLLNGTLDIHAPAAKEGSVAIEWKQVAAMPAVWAGAFVAVLSGFLLSLALRRRISPVGDNSAAAGAGGHNPGQKSQRHLRTAAEVILIAAVFGALVATPVLAHDGGHGEAPAAPSGDTPRKLPEGDVFVPKPLQRLLRVRTAVAEKQSAQTGMELIGAVIPDPSSAGQVQAPMDGQIELTDRGISFVGQKVEAGEVLAMLSPSMPVFERGSLQQLAAEVEGKVRIAEQKLSRLTRIAGVVPQRDIDDTQAELDALREQRRVLAPKSAEKLLLKAPVSGIISVATVRAGQVVTARDTLFEIVDPDRLWVEAIGNSGHGTDDISAAHALDGDGHVIKLSYIGRAPTLKQQSLPLLFKVEGSHPGLTIGSTVKVVIQGKAASEGIVLPHAAVVRGLNGLSQVWAKVSAERFKAVPVQAVSLDGSRVLVIAGLEQGSRVVVEGAELINQIR
jgi:cobalt-zinc-cadmium efflux system membrane fusion protein